jgi:hypothetical protein
VTLVAEGKLDPQLGGAVLAAHDRAMERLLNRDVAGKVALTVGD